MLLTDDLLKPIPGANPSGEYTRHSPLYDRIKDARREDDDAPQGDWTHEVKKADFALVCNLATDALRTKTKDIQIAAWLTEALTRRNGFAGFGEGLDYIRLLLETFWDSVYPEIEDGDAEMRVAPLEWIATKFDGVLKRVPLTSSGLDWIRYKESRKVGYEDDCRGNDAKLEARNVAISEGRISAEEFDQAVADSPPDFYDSAERSLAASLLSLQLLSDLCDAKFGDLSPTFSTLRGFLEESAMLVRGFKIKTQGRGATSIPAEVEYRPSDAAGSPSSEAVEPRFQTRQTPPAHHPAGGAEPIDADDAISQLLGVVVFLRNAQPTNPVPYLLVRGLRWGELLANPDVNFDLLEAPSSETRQQLKALYRDEQWQELLEATEKTIATPCGRGWLDLQRYTVAACEQLGSEFSTVVTAVTSGLTSLLKIIPELPHWSLTDDTPVASPDTLLWLQNDIVRRSTAPASMSIASTTDIQQIPDVTDVYTEAQQLARSGNPEQAIQVLAAELARSGDGRSRFQRKVQLAQICLLSNQEGIAYPILSALAQEIESRNLEQWETAESLAQPLALLLQCMEHVEHTAAERDAIYARLCRLNPMHALATARTSSRRRAA